MRIISKFFIVLFHVRMHSGIVSKALENNYLLLEFITNNSSSCKLIYYDIRILSV